MRKLSCVILFVGWTFLSPWASAEIRLNNLTIAEFENVFKEFSTNFLHSPVSGASSLGKEWGVEFGLVGGLTQTSYTNNIVRRLDSGNDLSWMYNFYFTGALTWQYGLTADVAFMPKVDMGSYNYTNYAFGLKWTATESVLQNLPVALAVRAHMSHAQMIFPLLVQLNTVKTNGTFNSDMTELAVQASRKFGPVEGYIGGGWLQAAGDLGTDGFGTIYSPLFTTSQKASTTQSDFEWLIGASYPVSSMTFSTEVDYVFATFRVNVKFGYTF